MNKINYQKETDKIIDNLKGVVPRLLLHSCCAPCSSYVIEYLAEYFAITVFYYNPNITNREEYMHRVNEQKRLISEMPVKHKVSFAEGDYSPEEYLSAVQGFEKCKEGGERCRICFNLRLERTAKEAKTGNYDFFATTLTVSPLKNPAVINQIGKNTEEKYNIRYLPSDFKKREGYKRSVALSAKYGLYRQNYCGCEFSKPEDN